MDLPVLVLIVAFPTGALIFVLVFNWWKRARARQLDEAGATDSAAEPEQPAADQPESPSSYGTGNGGTAEKPARESRSS